MKDATLPATRMSLYQTRFDQLRKQGQKAFIPYTLLGWPNRQASLEIIATMIRHGASALELGIAFSDPMADGPIIQQAAMETLAHGFRVPDALALLAEVRQLDADIPIGIMVYYNVVLARGPEAFLKALAQAGATGILIPDLPPEAADEVAPLAEAAGLDLILIVSPLTQPHRLPLMAKYAGGFWYAVSRLGITGLEERYDTQLQAMIQRVNAASPLPVCVGFGISTPQQAQEMVRLGADGVIVGSKIIDLVKKAPPGQSVDETLGPYLHSMAEACS